MDSDDLPDWLPADWNVQIITGEQRHVKCYVDPQGHKCYSKPQVFEYLRKMGQIPANENTVMQDNGDRSTVDLSMDPNAPDSNEIPESFPGGQLTKLTPRTSRRKSKPTGGSSSVDGSPHEPLSSQRYHGDSSWLPEGWTVEVRTRLSGTSSGMKFKCYTDPISGQKFFSKPQVLNHLAKTNRSVDGQNEVSTDPSSPTQISTWETEGTLAGNGSPSEPLSSQRKDGGDYSWLPEGWTVELKARKGGTNVGKNYKIFIDPISGHKFFSKPQVLNHLAKINGSAGGQKEGFTEPIIASPISSWRDNSATEVDNNENKTESARLSSGYENMTLTEEEMDLPSDPSKQTEISEELPNDTVPELNTNGSGIENPKPIRSITGGDFSSLIASRKEVRSISGGIFSSPKEEKLEWLPDGWDVEVRYKSSGVQYKIYKETSTGIKLYSKPQVLNYLNGGISNSRKRKEINSSGSPDSYDGSHSKRSITKRGNMKNSEFEEVITTCPADGLPPGWIKERRTKIFSTHKRNDPFFIDPATGYIFRSKLDALRFLDTGDINACAIRPKIKDKDGNEVNVYANTVSKPADTTNGEQLLEEGDDTKTADISPTDLPAPSSKDNIAVEEKQGSGVNLEKQPDDDGHLCYDIPEDDNWTDHCIDFAVKTLTSEIMFNGQPTSSAGAGFPEEGAAAAADAGVDPTGVNETPTKVN